MWGSRPLPELMVGPHAINGRQRRVSPTILGDGRYDVCGYASGQANTAGCGVVCLRRRVLLVATINAIPIILILCSRQFLRCHKALC